MNYEGFVQMNYSNYKQKSTILSSEEMDDTETTEVEDCSSDGRFDIVLEIVSVNTELSIEDIIKR